MKLFGKKTTKTAAQTEKLDMNQLKSIVGGLEESVIEISDSTTGTDTLSTTLKTKHDTAKNSIGNIR